MKFCRLFSQKVLVSLIIAMACLFSTGYAQKSSSQLKKDKQKIEKEISNTQSLLKKNEKNQKASLQQIAVLRQQISNREKLITTLNQEIIRMEEEQELNQQEILKLQKKLEYMKSDYAQVVYQAYRNRNLMDKITFILAADDFSQMFRRVRFYTVFSDNVRSQADKIAKTQAELKEKNEQIIALKSEKLNVLSGKENEIKKLESDRREKTKNAEALKKQSKQLTAQLQEKQRQRRELDAAIQKAIKAEIAAANAKRAAAAAASNKGKGTAASGNTSSGKGTAASTNTNPRNTASITLTPEERTLSNSFVSNKGSLPWPVAKGAKVGDYGNYAHPDVPSVMIENHGIDIMTDAGAPVRAIFSGEVTVVMDVVGSKVVIIRHGEYISVYQNLASVSVKKGDKVTTKQTIGTVGKNAASNTYELHFEIWKNEANLNPNTWLAKR